MKKRVLLIIPNLGRGGAQKVFFQQFHLLQQSFDVSGCVFNWDGALVSEKLPGIHSLDVPGGRNAFEKVYYFIKRIIELRKLKIRLRIDVSVSHLEGADYINLFSKSNDKVLCWIHGTKIYDQNISGSIGWIRKSLLIPFTYKRADQIATVSQGINDELRNSFGIDHRKLTTVYNGFDVNMIRSFSQEPIPEELRPLFDSPVVVTHCRLAVQKNLPALLEVFSRVKRQQVRLLILGDGELREELIARCRLLQIPTWNTWENVPVDSSARVFFAGHSANPYPLLARCTFYVMTSNWEGFPLALCEAMACGLPVVSSDCYTGPREILDPEGVLPKPATQPSWAEFGVLMPLVNTEDDRSLDTWAEFISNCIEDPEKIQRYREKGKIRILDFDLVATIAKSRKLIEKL